MLAVLLFGHFALFNTSTNLLGIGPPKFSVGDQVFAIGGLPCLAILRQKGDQWVYVGACRILIL